MNWEELFKPLGNAFFELGYKEIYDNHWISQTQELIIVLSIKIDTEERIFYIDMGIIFKKLHQNYLWENIDQEHYHVGQTLYNILWKMGEPLEYLDQLFSYDQEDYSNIVLKNISVIMDLYKNKVIRYFQKLDDYVFSAKNFTDKTTWQPFLEFLQANEYNTLFYKEQSGIFSPFTIPTDKLTMHHMQLLQTLSPPLEELGYKKMDDYTWVLKFDEFSIVSNIVRRDAPLFDIVLAIAFDLFEREFPLENYRCEMIKIETTLYELLLSFGEPAGHLNKLFYNNVNEDVGGELKNNIPAIMDLFKKKIIPYFENWNDYNWLIDNFEKGINNKTFTVYGPLDLLNFFYEQLEIKQWIKQNC